MSKKGEALSSELLIADALLQVKAIGNLLISKGVFTKEELNTEMGVITRQITKSLLEKAQVEGDLDQLIDSLINPKPQN